MVKTPATAIDARLQKAPAPATRDTGSKGPLLMLVSAFLFAVLWFLIKLLGPPFRVWDIAVYRLGGGTLVLLALFGWRQNLFRPARPGLMVLRGITGTIAFIFLVLALHRIPFSTGMVIFYSFPAFSALFSPLLFGDRIRRVDALSLAAAILGLAVLFDFHLGGSIEGQAMAVGSAVFAGLTISLIKKLRDTHGSVIIYFYLCLVGTLIAIGPFMAAPQIPSSALQWILVAAILITSIVAQLVMNHGFQYCESWEGGVLMTSEVLFSTIFGIFLLGEAVNWRFWTGALMIAGSAAVMNLQHRARTHAGSGPEGSRS